VHVVAVLQRPLPERCGVVLRLLRSSRPARTAARSSTGSPTANWRRCSTPTSPTQAHGWPSSAAEEPTFCAGHDRAELGWVNTLTTPPSGVGGLTARRDLDKPAIAAVSGAVLVGGLELTLACHLGVAADDAQFAVTQPSRSLVPEHGGPQRLLALVGERLATAMLLTGRRLDAAQALAAGLVNRVVPAGEHVTAALALAEEVLASSPTSVRALLRLRFGDVRGLDEVTFSEDLLIGLAAEGDGTAPAWTNT
ncbi:MAG: enoyl-CoA hydratase/isomerase family protein, partial [Nocardioidaceae bacterium]|nr:enoyl-CoA hydratase/isomerase family protein [Nocardioidaceae bacterium]